MFSPVRAYASLIAILGLALLASSLFLAFRPEPPIARALPLTLPSFSPESISKEFKEKSKELPAEAESPQGPRADASLKREGRSFISGGLLMLPPSFSSSDGRYDLVFHFHGNTELVADSYAHKRVNAVLVIVNLGTGSAVYERHFSSQGLFLDMLRRIRADLEKRGLKNAQLRRIGISAWSAGYGGVHALLRHPGLANSIDAVLLADGLHCGFGRDKQVDLALIKAFVRFAKLAYEHKKLFSIAHSEIASTQSSAGPRETTDALLNWLHIRRSPFSREPALPSFETARKAIGDEFWTPLSPETQAQMGGFFVRGYGGQKEEHHIMHLVQISETLLPDLIQWWSPKSSN